MAAHIFVLSEENYKICITKGIVALPEAKEGSRCDNVFDGLLSRISMVKENDYILMYVMGIKELRGVWLAEGEPFYDTTKIFNDKIYPFRSKIKCSNYNFKNPLHLNDINDLRNNGKIWTWALQRATGTNAMFSISDGEFDILLNEYAKINPFSSEKSIIPEPYSYHKNNLVEYIHFNKNAPKFEYSVMTLLNLSFANGQFKNIFGNYSDFLSYVPTNLGKEMDIVLMYNNPNNNKLISSYDIIEVKRDTFDAKALTQLIDYESWFLQKKVPGDLNMVRTTAIAKDYSSEVIDYVNKRTIFENKPIKLLTYEYLNDKFVLNEN